MYQAEIFCDEVLSSVILRCNAEAPDPTCRVLEFPLPIVHQGAVFLCTAEGILGFNLDQFGRCLVLCSSLEQGLSLCLSPCVK